MEEVVARKFESYPECVKEKMKQLRKLILEVASENEICDITECLKWGEPSYITKKGSTLRIDWKTTSPDKYAIYFNCNTKLLETFREIYPDIFEYSGKRAIVFDIKETIPVRELKHCISMSLRYHIIKHLPFLGA